MKRNLFLTFFSIFFAQFLHAQLYTPIDTADFAKRKKFIEEYTLKNQQFINVFKTKYPGKTGKDLVKRYEEFQKHFIKEIKDKNYTFNSNFDVYIKNIISNLRTKNANIPQDLRVLVSRSNIPNAYCLGDGTYVVNMGIFNWLENEDQIASVLSHELAHYLLEHSEKSQVRFVNQDITNKAQVLTLKTTAINRTEKAFDIFKKQMYTERNERRKHEKEADSLGYLLFKNSNYAKAEFLNSLKTLQEFDTISPREVKPETYKKLYDLPTQPFKEKWMKMEDFSAYNYDFYKEKLDKDSLSTHPEIQERLAILQKKFDELKTEIKPKSPSDEFKNFRKIARLEILPNFYNTEDYGVGIYSAMQLIQDGEEEEYHKKWLGKCFQKIYEARKAYNLNRYLDKVEPKDQSKSYQQFLNFMWNLTLDEIKGIADYYQKSS